MSSDGAKTLIKLFSNREFEDVVIANSKLPEIAAFAARSRDRHAPGRTIEDVCKMSMRDYLIGLVPATPEQAAVIAENAARPAMLLASMNDPLFRVDDDNTVLVEAWPMKFGCAVYSSTMAGAYAADLVRAREFLARSFGMVPLSPLVRPLGTTLQ